MKTTAALLLICVFTVFSSCKNDRDPAIISSNKVKIDSVKPTVDTLTLGMMQTIRTYSNYQNNCEGFDGYDYVHENFTRYVTPYKFQTDESCGATVARLTSFNFKPVAIGTYTFKFWNGTNAAGADLWIDREIVVVN